MPNVITNGFKQTIRFNDMFKINKEKIYKINISEEVMTKLLSRSNSEGFHKLAYKINSLIIYYKQNFAPHFMFGVSQSSSVRHKPFNQFISLSKNEYRFLSDEIKKIDKDYITLTELDYSEYMFLYNDCVNDFTKNVTETNYNSFDIVDVVLNSEYKFLSLTKPKFAKRILNFVQNYYYPEYRNDIEDVKEFSVNDYITFQPRLMHYFNKLREQL